MTTADRIVILTVAAVCIAAGVHRLLATRRRNAYNALLYRITGVRPGRQ
jgi:hypothetical protein